MHMQMVMLFLIAIVMRLGTIDITIVSLLIAGVVRRRMLLMVVLVIYIGFV